ncbi:CRS2-associated factor 2, mitochondrial [Linum grandiflorum]
MLRKLLSFPDRAAKITDIPSPCFLYISNLSAHSQSYDPPFSLISKPKPKPSPKPKQTQPKQNASPTDPSPKLPVKSDLPFDFRYSYSEHNPAVQPIGYREKKRFSPFGPRRLDREWTGTAAPAQSLVVDQEKAVEERNRIIGDPLTAEEVEELVERYRHSDCSRQINLGKGGVTHNMLDDIHNHWKRAEAVRIKCLGVPTLDMDNVCFHLEIFRL